MKHWSIALFILMMTFGVAAPGSAQEDSHLPPTDEELQKEKAERENKAFTLLEDVVDEAQLLRLPENRIRLQIGAAELLWPRNEGRARTLFALAADGVSELLRNANTETGINEERSFNRTRTPTQLRQELVLTVARHDATLAYQLLAATRPPTPPPGTPGTSGATNAEDRLEERLLAQVASQDPKLALQNAEELIEKGQFPRSLAEVLAQLQRKDKEAAAKLEDKMLKRLASANMLNSSDAVSLALRLLQGGPRPAGSTNSAAAAANVRGPLLGQSAYADLMGVLIDAALKATPQPAGTQRGQTRVRGRLAARGGASQATAPDAPSEAEIEQSNARRLLSGLQMLLPQIDQNVPARAQAVRQKIAELGVANNPRAAMGQFPTNMQEGTSESMLSAAAAAPERVQSRLYHQAAMRALEEGNADRARQIANDHLEPAARESVLKTVEFRQITAKASANNIEEVRLTLSRLRNDDERIELLLRLSAAAQPDNTKLALQLLDEARQFTNKRARNYQHFDQQLRVAGAFKDLDPARSFEVLEPGIAQLNELLSAAATLSGFEVNVFREGELPLQGGSGLSNIVTRYGQELGVLALRDFDRAQTLANRFQLTEPRILARLSIVRGMLGIDSLPVDGSRRFGQNTFVRRGQ